MSTKEKSHNCRAGAVCLLILLCCWSCINDDEGINLEFTYPVLDSLEFSVCLPTASVVNKHALSVSSNGDGLLRFSDFNSELCCESDSVLVWLYHGSDSITVHIVDMGPYSWCFCPSRIDYRITAPAGHENLVFTVLESQSAFKRDTFLFSLPLHTVLDTVFYPIGSEKALPPELLSTGLYGCNQADSLSAVNLGLTGPDTTWLEYRDDSIILTTALNYGCCAPFVCSCDDSGDSLVFIVEDTCAYPDEDCYCDCSCLYLFSFVMKKREESLFPYKLVLVNAFNDDPVLLWWGAIDTRVF